jgi:pyruvate carboxylase
MMRGNLGQPPGGFPPGILKKVLKDEQPILERPGKGVPPSTWRPSAPRSRRAWRWRSMTRT